MFASTYAMRESKGMTPKKMFPELFKDEYEVPDAPLTEDEFKYEQELIKNFTW